jgi:Na+/H+ antiporter NhaD/arsenite permease-like protein
MGIELVTIFVLLIMFVIGSVIAINIGVLGFVAAFVVGTFFGGLSVKDIYSAFPVDMFILLAGVTYLFAIAQNNGTLNLIMNWGLRLVRGNLALLPWVIFGLSALLTSVGASTVAVAPILFPIGLRLAFQYNINPILMGTLISTGMYAGSFSPLNIFGLVVNGIMQSEGLPHSPGLLFLNCFLFYILISFLVFVVFGGLKRRPALQDYIAAAADGVHRPDSSGANPAEQAEGLTLYKGITLASIVFLVVIALGFGVNMGFGAFMVGLALALMAPKKQADVLKQMPWSVMMMVTGIMTYVGVMEKIGTLDYMTELIASVGNPVLAALAACYVGGVVSSFASTTGFLAAVIPLAAPILQDSTISSIGVVSAIAIASSVVDLSPFSTNGALILANVQGVNDRLFFRKLLHTAMVFIALGPGLAWLIFVLIGTPW